MTIWKEIIDNWSKGPTWSSHGPPQLIGDPIFDEIDKFRWNTSYISKDFKSVFRQKKKRAEKLPDTQNYESFKEYIKKEKNKKNGNKYATSFYNLNKDTRLVIPMPRRGKNYATLTHFLLFAPQIQIRNFWKYVAKQIKKEMKKNERLYVSTHGMGVPYMHVRISSKPKYYFDKSLAHTADRK